MKSKGIRIEDSINHVISVQLVDILEEIKCENISYWSILFLDAMGNIGKSITEFGDQIYESPKGFFITWKELYEMSTKFEQIIDIVIIGCNDLESVHRYDEDQEMYESCDIVIVMFDTCFWEVFSKDVSLINRLAAKFKKTKFLETDFQKTSPKYTLIHHLKHDMQKREPPN